MLLTSGTLNRSKYSQARHTLRCRHYVHIRRHHQRGRCGDGGALCYCCIPKLLSPYLHCKGMKLEINDSRSVVSLPLPLSPLQPLLSNLIVKLSITFSTVVSSSQDQFSLFVTHRQKTSCMLALLFLNKSVQQHSVLPTGQSHLLLHARHWDISVFCVLSTYHLLCNLYFCSLHILLFFHCSSQYPLNWPRNAKISVFIFFCYNTLLHLILYFSVSCVLLFHVSYGPTSELLICKGRQ